MPLPQRNDSSFWLRRFVPAYLLQIIVELVGKVLHSTIRLQALDLPLCFPLDKIFQVPEIVKNFTLLFDEVDPCVLAIVVDEGDEISTPAKTHVLFWFSYI